MKKNIIQRTLALVLTIAALAMTQAAMAVSTFTIEPEGNGNTFKIKRSDTSKAETVKYYTISLSALAGVHFTKTDGEYTFPVGTDSYSVTVPETAVNNIAAKYLYYSGSGHTYRFLVADKNGFEYKHLDRTLTYDGYTLLMIAAMTKTAISPCPAATTSTMLRQRATSRPLEPNCA